MTNLRNVIQSITGFTKLDWFNTVIILAALAMFLFAWKSLSHLNR